MSQIFWLRAETKENEFRRAITPHDAQKMIQAGHKVIVEDWNESIIPTSEYSSIGCEIVSSGSWKQAPKEAIIVGLKALPEDIESFQHTHIYFAHAYKQQEGYQELLSKFIKGGGKIIDLEYMIDENQRRVCAFGYWAGYVGSALGALFASSSNPDISTQKLAEKKYFKDKKSLVDFVKSQSLNDSKNNAVVIGASGRCGSGAKDFLAELNWNVDGWDRQETEVGGPFPQLLDYKLLVNCVLAVEKCPPFINKETIQAADQFCLNTISDVSCDPDSEYNMIPLYKEATKLEQPYIQVEGGIKLTAIDNLPSFLPKESSYDFSSQLSPFLMDYQTDNGPIKRSLGFFNEAIKQLGNINS